MRYFIGIDISKDHYTAYCETEQGEKVFEKKGENLGKGYRELLSEMEKKRYRERGGSNRSRVFR